MESQEERWLKQQYSAVESGSESSSLELKKGKYSDIQEKLRDQFPTVSFSTKSTNDLIKRTFPTSFNKRCESLREMYVIGIERSEQESGSEVEQLRAQAAELQRQVAELERSQSQSGWSTKVRYEPIIHGPDTVEHFKDFSIDQINHELKEQAPDVYDLFSKLTRSDRPPDRYKNFTA